MKLHPHIHLVGSGRNGFDLTDPSHCHVYLIDSSTEAVLIDAGSGINMGTIVEQIETSVDPKKLTTLILTHKHGDHAGGAAFLKERYGLRVVASEHTAQVVSTADEAKMSLPEAKAAGGYPKDFVFRACPVDHVVHEGDIVTAGDVRFEVIDTPGHCHGHISLLAHIGEYRALFSGDSLFHGGRVVWQATYDCSVQEHIQSIVKLNHYDFDGLFPGHMLFSLAHGKVHVQSAMERINRLQVPLHLV